jgi:hypothetical protein
MMFPKHNYVRSKKLLENARLIPCQRCGAEDGTVVAAHTNWGSGKGRGIKADDNMIASLCYECHMMIDQGKDLPWYERQEKWSLAHYKTVKKLVLLGLWPDDVPIPKGLSGCAKDWLS